ncbi:MAG: aconitate hydratase, partial [Armatimonadetes bacterium]|nr:aconitate hydratase [Armatimonadota bacterium]
DNISTDQIIPAGAKILPLRSNIPAISEHLFEPIDREFAARAQEQGGGIILGGRNYGQGSSREHAALAPAYLGVRAVLAVSFARIHRANLINFGIVPIEISPQDYGRCQQGNELRIEDVRAGVQGGGQLIIENATKGFSFTGSCPLAERQAQILLAGGALNWAKQKLKGEEQ